MAARSELLERGALRGEARQRFGLRLPAEISEIVIYRACIGGLDWRFVAA
jgi:hypothetical protein